MRFVAVSFVALALTACAPTQETVATHAGSSPPSPAWAAGSQAAQLRLNQRLWYSTMVWNQTLRYSEPVGEGRADLPRATPRARAGGSALSSWDRVAACESGNDWSTNTGNGYYGGLQENMAFWHAHGGDQYASRPDLATREQQIAVAEDAGSRAPWPVCGSR